MLALLAIFGLGAGYILMDHPSRDDPDNHSLGKSNRDEDCEGEHGFAILDGAPESAEEVLNLMDGTLLDPSLDHDAIIGGKNFDILNGTANDDVMSGQEGDDVMTSLEGSNLVYGGQGDDSLTTGSGDDVIFGEADDDTVEAGSGDDEVFGGVGKDTLHGQSGNDYIHGGDDTESDLLIGGAGDDVIVANTTDRVLSGGGKDVIVTHLNAGIQVFDFDTEKDTLVISKADGIQVDDLVWKDTDSGLKIQYDGQPIVTLAGLTSASVVKIVIE